MTALPKLQQGFSLVSAIFLLVVIAALGAFSLTLSSTQQQSAALDVMGSRAFQASRAGIEWGAYQVSQVPAGAFATACGAGGPTTQVLPAGTLAGTLSGFDVTVVCTAIVQNDVIAATGAAGPVTVYAIVSTAAVAGAAPGSPDYVERRMQVTMGSIGP